MFEGEIIFPSFFYCYLKLITLHYMYEMFN